MSKVYKCKLTDAITFNIEADSEEDLNDYLCNTTANDIISDKSLYDSKTATVHYTEEILQEITDEDYDITISKEMSNARVSELFNSLIDTLIQRDGMQITPTIELLKDIGASRREILKMAFNPELVDSVFENNDK